MVKKTGRELFQLTGISETHLSRIFRRIRRASIKTAKKLEQVTGVRWEAWLDPDSYENPYIQKKEAENGNPTLRRRRKRHPDQTV